MYMSGDSSLTDSKLQNSTLVQAACSRRQKDCMDECVLDNWCTTAEQLNKPQFSGKWNLLAFWQYITSHHTLLLVCSPLIVAGAGSCHANYKLQCAVPDPCIHICTQWLLYRWDSYLKTMFPAEQHEHGYWIHEHYILEYKRKESQWETDNRMCIRQWATQDLLCNSDKLQSKEEH